ncbi:MAG: tRNA dihydrouridine synthase DusB [Holosporales bacterium]|jgi:tRNA-dihydrouridine synthase B|nr:tRNA dihydrouridine synthase DusB [Holosporales bacterium]
MPELKLGNISLKSRVLLAPMSGITDPPFRRIIREFGDFLMFSEMIASQAMVRQVQRTKKMLEGIEDDFTSVQIVGSSPQIMADTARLCSDLGARFIDINMGCPVKKIVKSEAGSALMKNETLVAQILESVVNAVSIPVTLKTRLGWDMEHKNFLTISKIAENSGIQMLTIHGRTRSQLYSGKADWKEIRKVKETVNIPVIVNGDIIDIDSANKALNESKADGVMIGRGVLGNPWILLDIHNFIEKIPSSSNFNLNEKLKIAKRHIEYVFDFYNSETAIKISRRVLTSYCKGIFNAAKYRQQINTLTEQIQIFELLELLFAEQGYG